MSREEEEGEKARTGDGWSERARETNQKFM